MLLEQFSGTEVYSIWQINITCNRGRSACCAGITGLRGTCFMPLPTDRCVGGIMFSGCPSVSESVRPGVRLVSTICYKPVDGISPNFDGWCRWQMNWLGFEGRGIHVKVTARSNIWVAYCGRRRHPHRHLGIEVGLSPTFSVCGMLTAGRRNRMN